MTDYENIHPPTPEEQADMHHMLDSAHRLRRANIVGALGGFGIVALGIAERDSAKIAIGSGISVLTGTIAFKWNAFIRDFSNDV